jgi:hypothetical protein
LKERKDRSAADFFSGFFIEGKNMKNKKTTQNENKFHLLLNDENEKRNAAERISEKICSANKLAKIAWNKQSRETALKLKSSLISFGFIRFGDYFKAKAYTLHAHLGVVIWVELANRKAVLIPLAKLTKEGQSSIDLSFLPNRLELPLSKRQPLFNFDQTGQDRFGRINRLLQWRDQHYLLTSGEKR